MATHKNWTEDLREKQARSALQRLSKEDHIRWQRRLAEKGLGGSKLAMVEHGGAGFTATQNYIFDLEGQRLELQG